MAPPLKRRRVSYTTSEDSTTLEAVAQMDTTLGFSHGVEHIPHLHLSTHTSSRPRQIPQRVEEVHLEIREVAILAPDTHPRLHRRQGTAVSSSATQTASSATSSDSTGSSIAVETTIDSSSGASSYTTMSTATSVSSAVSGSTDSVQSSSDTSSMPAPSLTDAVQSTNDTSSTAAPSSTDSVQSSNDVISSAISSNNTSSVATSSGTSSQAALSSSVNTSSETSLSGNTISSPASTDTSTAQGFIGLSPSGSTAPSTIASPTGNNATIVSSALSASLGAGSSSTGSLASNMTTSGELELPHMNIDVANALLAIIIENSSITYTSQTTIDLASETSSSGTQSAASSSQTSSGALVYLATLRDGAVETVTRSSNSYATTFSDGQVSTIAPYSGSGASSQTSIASSQTTSSPGAFMYLATLRDGAVVTITRSSSSYDMTFSDGQVSTIAPYSGTLAVTTLSDGATSTYYTTLPASSGSNAAQSTVTSTAVAGQTGGSATSSATSSTGSPVSHSSNSNSTPPAGTIAGGVVGGAAGLAVVLLVAMLFLRWYRRKGQTGHQALPANSGLSPEPEHAVVSGGPGMAERAGLIPAFGAVPAFFRHQNRSREGPEPAERGFTRVSGRKLPSTFSPGMSSPPPTMPLNATSFSNASFYRDSAGFYGGEGETPSPAAQELPAEEAMTLSPGPQRRPTVHAPGPYTLSPTASSPTSPRNPADMTRSPPGTGTTATFDRSDTPSSLDPNRSSKFTEEV